MPSYKLEIAFNAHDDREALDSVREIRESIQFKHLESTLLFRYNDDYSLTGIEDDYDDDAGN